MDASSVRSLLREVSDTIVLLLMTGLVLGGYLGIALFVVGAVK